MRTKRPVGDVYKAFTTAVAVAAPFAGSALPPDIGTTTPPPNSISQLTWAPPTQRYARTLTIEGPGTYRMDSRYDYRIVTTKVINGPVALVGGRNVTWLGGEITIPAGTPGQRATDRRGLVIVDHDETRGDPARYGGHSRDGRIVHIEGLRIGGPGLAEGINTNAPSAVVQLQNINVGTVAFANSDDRDGVFGWPAKNHPDVLQTWGSQRELRVDGLTGTTAYQGIFLKEDAADAVHGKVFLRRVDITATSITGTDGLEYSGHRTFSFYPEQVGEVRLDEGTVRMTHSPESGWVSNPTNPSWRTFHPTRTYDETTGTHALNPPPGTSTFVDTLGDGVATTGEDVKGTFGTWPSSAGTLGRVLDWRGRKAGRVYSNEGTGITYVPASSVGLGYRSPGYMKASRWRTSVVS